ncbi:MFS transporter [Pararhodospirillum oryzae]|uniref:MFS transporter n=1 Tax=Pararhodospirillum oryzae TaxID=478448 RepID=A0A512H9Z5_9PROT|nr:MFS transporter [Pararhodospirillum oryzae]GEO82252.1 MFS transporter [Pararhodospirillum oryzae]
MPGLVLSLSSLLGGIAFLLLGNGLLGTVLGVRLADRGDGPLVSSLILGCYFVGLIVGSWRLSRVVLAIGHIRTFALLASVQAAATLGHALTPSPVAWAAFRLIEGICMAGLFMCIESWLNDRATEESRGTVLSAYMISVYLAQGVGQLLLMTHDPRNFALFAVASILVSLAVLPVVTTRLPSPELVAAPPFRPGRLMASSPTAFLGSAASGLGLGALYAMGPLFAREIGFDRNGVALFMCAAILGGLVLQWPLGRLSDRLDRRLVLQGVAVALGVVCVAIAFLAPGTETAVPTGGLGPFVALAALFGSLITVIYPVSVALANDRIAPGERVGVSGDLLLVNSVGSVVGPLVAAVLMELNGPVGLFVFEALVAVGLGLVTLWRRRVREAPPEDQRPPFQPLPVPAPVAGEIEIQAPLSAPPDPETAP